MTSRARILQNLRDALRHGGPLEPRPPLPETLRPALDADVPGQFCRNLEKAAASFARVVGNNAIPVAAREFLQARDLPLQLVADAAVARLAWPPEFSVQERPIKATDRVSIAWAVAGIAETGSVVLVPANGAALNFLPEAQIVIVSRLVGWIEQAYSLLTPWPRHVNFITGPSRTADIEQTLQLGAHGPRHLHVLLSDSSPA